MMREIPKDSLDQLNEFLSFVSPYKCRLWIDKDYEDKDRTRIKVQARVVNDNYSTLATIYASEKKTRRVIVFLPGYFNDSQLKLSELFCDDLKDGKAYEDGYSFNYSLDDYNAKMSESDPCDDLPKPELKPTTMKWNPKVFLPVDTNSFELAKSLAKVTDNYVNKDDDHHKDAFNESAKALSERIQDSLSDALKKTFGKVNDGFFEDDTDDNKAPDYYTDDEGHDLFWHFKNGLLTVEQYKGFLLGNIYKYLSRHGKKDGELSQKDLHKALNYLNELIAFEGGEYE